MSQLPTQCSYRWRLLLLAVTSLLGPALLGLPAFAADDGSVELFRRIFYEELAGTYDDATIETLILPPTPALTAPFAVLDAEQPFAELDQRLGTVSPKDLYEAGRRQGFAYADKPGDGEEPQAGPASPATIILAAGIGNEMVSAPPFPAVLAQDSSFKREWQELLARLTPAQRLMKVYSWKEFGEVELDISELFQVGSIDAPDGKPYVRYVFVVPVYGSFDSVGSVDWMAAALEKRLEQLFAILPRQDHLYLGGYSQGANVVVQLAARQGARAPAAPWFQQVRGVLSLGGPLFGSQLASQALQAGNPTYEILTALEELHEGLLDDYQSLLEIPALMLKNTLLWQQAMRKIGEAHARYQTLHQGLADEASPPASFPLSSVVKTLAATGLSQLQKSAPAWQYFGNIKRLKLMLAKAIEAARALANAERLHWWRTHELPTHLKYLAIAGVMPSARDRQNDDPLARALGAGVNTLDFAFLRATFYDIFWATGIDLNDSQVMVREAFFWPAVHQAINRRQSPYQAYNLGILGTNHWGMALPGSLVPEGPLANGFPRSALLKALGRTILALEKAE